MPRTKSQWTEGLSATSVSRFGGWDNTCVHRTNGMLGVSAGVNELYVGAGRDIHLGRYEPRQPWYVTTEADWACLRHRMQSPKGKTIAQVYQSLLSPGVLFDVTGREFVWFNERSCEFIHILYPTAQGAKLVISNRTFTEPLSEPWVLAIAHVHGQRIVVPLLFVLQHRPTEVYNINGDYHAFHFAGKAGRVAVMPLHGPARFGREQLGFKGDQAPKELLDRCRYWASVLLAYPIECKEEFQIDEEARTVAIRDRFRYLGGANDWNWPVRKLAPVSPTLSMAARRGYPIQFTPQLQDTGMLTYLGHFEAAEGDEVTCTLPLFDYLEKTVAPVRITGSPEADRITHRLKEYLGKPEDNLTFGGDDTFDTKNIQDVLHDMRVLAWSTWSLDEADRKKVAARMTKYLSAFDPRNFRVWEETYSGQRFLAEKEIWQSSHGDVTYDYEWYNGMQLAGLWAGLYFLEQPGKFEALFKKRWDLVEDVARYFFLFTDWATSSFWTDMIGDFMWMDGFHFGWQGLIGLYRIARHAGRTETAQQAAYLVSKLAVARWVTWLMTDYVQEATTKGLSLRGAGGPHDQKAVEWDSQIIGGFFEKEGFVMSPTFAAGNALGYMVPEQYLFYRHEPRIRERVRQGQHEHLPKQTPNWNKRPEVFGYGKGPFPYPSHWHFYLVDDQFFVRSMVLRDSMESMTKLIGEEDYSGPLMESLLVAGAPMAVVPTRATFRGNLWDAQARTLTVSLTTEQPGLELEVTWPDRPAAVEGATVKRYDEDTQRVVLELPEGEAEVKVRY